jgi:hypothetical protein
MIECLIAIAVVAVALVSGARAEDKFQKLNGAQIQAKFAGMEMTDQVHWGDVYQRNGVLVTTEMGHKTTGNGALKTTGFAWIAPVSWEADVTKYGSPERMSS